MKKLLLALVGLAIAPNIAFSDQTHIFKNSISLALSIQADPLKSSHTSTLLHKICSMSSCASACSSAYEACLSNHQSNCALNDNACNNSCTQTCDDP